MIKRTRQRVGEPLTPALHYKYLTHASLARSADVDLRPLRTASSTHSEAPFAIRPPGQGGVGVMTDERWEVACEPWSFCR